MKITIEQPHQNEPDEIIIKCREISAELLALINAVKTSESKLVASVGNEIHRVSPADIFYAEAVDNKTFLYCRREVYESKQKLYELEAILSARDFLRISKSVIVNLGKIKSLAPALSGRLEATLANGERVIVSRQYVGGLKKSLGI